jgi:eukaryotic-like serine/threonine-protein kinase
MALTPNYEQNKTGEFDIMNSIDTSSANMVLLNWLLDNSLVMSEEWDELSLITKTEICDAISTEAMIDRLVECQLLTEYQAELTRLGRGLQARLGSYRLLLELGRGGMGIVYLAEHILLRRRVAIKTSTHLLEKHPRLLHRFYAESRSVARLQHPNIVGCLDAGRHRTGDGASARTIEYFVMEYVIGDDLDAYVRKNGPLSIRRAAEVFQQIAKALAEAHKHGLVHRDLKPSNIIVTPEMQAKLLDFGLALHPTHAMTEPGTILGTVGYMAPEQARDPHAVDGRADLFALGATLYWALTGREPYPETGNPVADLSRRLTAPPPDIRHVRAEIPSDLAELILQLLQTDPDRRYQSATDVATALEPFTRWSLVSYSDTSDQIQRTRVLIVDRDPMARYHLDSLLNTEFEIRETASGQEAIRCVESEPIDLLILDASPEGCTAAELIRTIQTLSGDRHIMILVISGTVPISVLSGLISVGADDFLTKPFTPVELRSRIRALLGRRATLNTHRVMTLETMRLTTAQLTRTPMPILPAASASSWDLMTVTISRLLVEAGFLARGYRSRLARYIRALAQKAPVENEYVRLKDSNYLSMLSSSSSLFDIGLLVIPGGLSLKPGKLDPDERQVIETHPTAGAEIIAGLAEKFPSEMGCVALAAELIRGHHERWDGLGYPDQLAGSSIPLAARIVAITSVYDSLRSRRPYRPALTHSRALKTIIAEGEGRYDPVLVQSFDACSQRIETIFSEYPAT